MSRPKNKFSKKEMARVDSYGLWPDRFDSLYRTQEGKCAICHIHVSEDSINVDHDHLTGLVRGLLCWSCNVGLGHFKDDPTYLKKAASYLVLSKRKKRVWNNPKDVKRRH